MKYSDGSTILVGDRIILENNELATVVLVMNPLDNDNNFPKCDWPDIRDGILVKTDFGALVQFHDCHSDLISRV